MRGAGTPQPAAPVRTLAMRAALERELEAARLAAEEAELEAIVKANRFKLFW
jgi:hypothetical protein